MENLNLANLTGDRAIEEATGMTVNPCPFCGTKRNVQMVDLQEISGREEAYLLHCLVVCCGYCGALGPTALPDVRPDVSISPEMELRTVKRAVRRWNGDWRFEEGESNGNQAEK